MAALYVEQCESCHGDEKGNNPGIGGALTKPECNACTSIDALANYISVAMPLGNSANCTGECADNLANYIFDEFDGYRTAPIGAAQKLTPGEEFNCNANVIPDLGDNVVRRLTKEDYVRTILNITGVDVSAEAGAIPDLPPVVRSFNNNAIEVTVSRAHIETFHEIAEAVAPSLQSWLDSQLTCSRFDRNCETEIIESLAMQLYRGPAKDAEIEALRGIFAAGRRAEASFSESASYVLQAMLQAPRFIYRVENELGNGEIREISAYELASRLSYAVWGSAPDQQLLEAAALDHEQVLAQLERMLNDPKAIEYGTQFLSDWFDLHRLDNTSVDQDKFGDFDERLFADMADETTALFKHVLENDLPITTIYNLQQTWVSEALAEHYGFDSPRRGVNSYDLSSEANRGGLLTQSAMHNIGGNESSTVRRGLFMLNQVLCSKMEPPPGDVDTTPPPDEPGKSIRDISEDRVQNASCGSCHSQFEPLVWGLVPFDAVGDYHLTDEHNNTLPEDGYVVFPGGEGTRQYSDAGELADVLAESQRTADCALLKSFEFMMAREPSTADSCSLNSAKQAVSANSGTYKDIVRALVLSEKFSHIRTESN